MNGHVRAIVTSVVLLACAFAVVFTATASRGASSNATSRDTNGLLAYAGLVGKHPTAFQIFTVQPDGTHVHQLTHFGDNLERAAARMPDWSPDGRKIIFTRYWGEYQPPVISALDHERRRERHARRHVARARRTSQLPPRRPHPLLPG